MSACEKCWRDSRSADEPNVEYVRLIESRQCTPEEQAGPDADECPVCERMTKHQHTGELMCGCDPTPWCNGCGAKRERDCACGPIAANN